MKKWFLLLTLLSIIFFTGLNKMIGGNTYHYSVTVIFTLICLICYSILTFLSYRSGTTMKNINYIYFFSMGVLMTFAFFVIIVKNLTYSTFDKLYFTQLKFSQILLFSFALFLTKIEKKTKWLNLMILTVFSINLYLAFVFFRMGIMDYLPLIMYIELFICYEMFSEKAVKLSFKEVLIYNILSELFFLNYLKTNNFLSYITALMVFLFGLFKIVSSFSEILNRDYYRKQYTKEKKSNKLLNLIDKPIIILREFNIKKINKSCLELFGYNSVGELRGQSIFTFLKFEDFDSANFDNGLEDGEKKVSITLANGKTHKMLVEIYRIKGIKTGEYILEFKEEVSFGDIFYKLNDTLENVVYIYDEEEGYKYVSQGIVGLLHYEPQDFYNDKWFTKKISLDNKFEKVLKEKENQSSFMARYKTKEGEIVYLKENVKRISLGERSIYYGIVTEVTEFISEIEELNAIKKDLEEKNSKKDMSMSIVSHEIRTPITAIIGFLENIIINNRTIEKTIDNMIKKAYSNSIRLKELVNNLLDLNKLNAGKLEIYKEPNDLKALVDEVLLNNETLLEIKNIGYKSDIIEKVEVFCDSSMLYQIINNVVSNSIKYNKENGKLNISLIDEGKTVLLNIMDTGIGIPEENKDRVFLEYERVRGSKEKGTGLGLPLAKRLMEINDGEIWFDSQVEKGTTFHLRLNKV